MHKVPPRCWRSAPSSARGTCHSHAGCLPGRSSGVSDPGAHRGGQTEDPSFSLIHHIQHAAGHTQRRGCSRPVQRIWQHSSQRDPVLTGAVSTVGIFKDSVVAEARSHALLLAVSSVRSFCRPGRPPPAATSHWCSTTCGGVEALQVCLQAAYRGLPSSAWAASSSWEPTRRSAALCCKELVPSDRPELRPAGERRGESVSGSGTPHRPERPLGLHAAGPPQAEGHLVLVGPAGLVPLPRGLYSCSLALCGLS
ncbi:mitochondrial S-adenosylmethionine carrier protein isoform X2 [Brachyistius frenatus]|uniref:mitochondrial S-adenosylmethionine carrier protein isoform X2 n=1 Tax=Brachyistius frenatus TaxID=100188 RepID=UPI0037E8185B